MSPAGKGFPLREGHSDRSRLRRSSISAAISLGLRSAGRGLGLQLLDVIALPAVEQVAGDTQLIGHLLGGMALYQYKPNGFLLELSAVAPLARNISILSNRQSPVHFF